VLINGMDPANPLGPGIPSPFGESGMTRSPGTYIAFCNGHPVLLVQNYGARLWAAREVAEELVDEAVEELIGLTLLPGELRPVKQLDVEYINGVRAALDPLSALLHKRGFVRAANQTLRFEGYR
jgi:hypothetical protein